MRKLILCGLITAILVLVACQAPDAASHSDGISGNNTAVESQAEDPPALSAEDTIRRFFECFNNRDSDAINVLMVEGHSMTLTEEESAKLTLKSCTELQSDEAASLVEAVFDVELDERRQSSFDEGEYTWRFELVKSSDGIWRITNYGV